MIIRILQFAFPFGDKFQPEGQTCVIRHDQRKIYAKHRKECRYDDDRRHHGCGNHAGKRRNATADCCGNGICDRSVGL